MGLVILLLLRVHLDCKKLGEGASRHVIPIVLFPIIFGIFWFFVWPGTLRLVLRGESIDDLVVAKALRRKKSLK